MLIAVAVAALSLPASSPIAVPDPDFTPIRPIPTYIQIDPPKRVLDEEATRPRLMFAEGDPLVLFMNRNGGTYTCGDDDAATNRSSIACSRDDGTAVITPFAGTDAQWTDTFQCIKDLYAPFHVVVTDVEPEGGDYIEAVIGGSPSQAGMSNGVAGVAPFTCGLIPGAVVYDFADVWGNDLQSSCETAGQEVAHAFGLDHEFMCQDPMTYLTGCGEKAFQDAFVPCGEFEPRECTCGGATQNSVDFMMNLFGPADGTSWEPPVDTELPTVLLTEPANHAILPANSEITVHARVHDDTRITAVSIEWDFTGEEMACPAGAGGAFTCTQSGLDVEWKIQAGVGARTFRVKVRDYVGNEVKSPDVTIWLSPDGSGPPPDAEAPTIVIGAPLADAIYPLATPFDVVATAVDDTGVAKVELNWQRGGQDRWIPCPYDDGRTVCTADGSTYRWTVQQRRAGDRSYQVRATDLVGNVTTTDLATLSFADGAELPTPDGNDSLDEAASLKCGQTVDVVGDADWFVIDAAAGDDVSVKISGDAASAVATDGTNLLGSGASFHVTAGDDPFAIGVSPSSSTKPAAITVQCTEAKKPAPKTGCGAAEVPPFFALASLLALVRRRRR